MRRAAAGATRGGMVAGGGATAPAIQSTSGDRRWRPESKVAAVRSRDDRACELIGEEMSGVRVDS